ncbi:MAG: twin transmembrane helix small protein [Rugosibacter sp.]|nr:twin transmembrane helix small protein [Rugosibacter sp.]
MKIIVILILVSIFASLFSALFFLFQDKTGSTRTVKALTLRISLSIALFILLMIAHYFGVIAK